MKSNKVLILLATAAVLTSCQIAKVEEQDAESFMNEINKYKEDAISDDSDFGGFTTTNNEQKKVESKSKKHYTKKTVEKNKIENDETVELDSKVDEIQDIDNIENSQTNFDFLSQMEENLKKSQEERLEKKKTKKDSAKVKEKEEKKEPKKRGRKPKNQQE